MIKVFILATCRKRELLPYSVLVFKTLRTGFPSAKVDVFLNNPKDGTSEEIESAAKSSGCNIQHADTIHHEWIESLTQKESEPFWICDTDVVFWDSVEELTFDAPIAGRRIHEFKDPFSGCITRARLHPSLMYINPHETRKAISDYSRRIYHSPFTPIANLFYPLVIPLKEDPIFYDTCSALYHAIGGRAFNDSQLDRYDHFNFGTIGDLVLPRLPDGVVMANSRDEALNDFRKLRGAWRNQENWYAERLPTFQGEDVIAKIKQDDAEDAIEWNKELCCGNAEAMSFCDIWYNYCHGIDDLIDTVEDGRPIMSKDQMISLFFMAAWLYNSAFYKHHRDLLFPIVLQVTNAYADSVAWEKSPKKHLRIMGDVMRTCGNEMYKFVALICGGEQHMKNMGRKIMERDWLGQHDENGKPI